MKIREADLPIDVLCCDQGWILICKIIQTTKIPEQAWDQLCRQRAFLKT